MYNAARALLFRLDAEKAHHLTLQMLQAVYRVGFSKAVFGKPPQVQPVSLMGLQLPNAVGLAAGLDKNGRYIDALAALGFGFIEIGTLTPKPQPGNPRPRLFRLPEHHAIINRMGFNNDGIDAALERIARSRYRGVLGINIGKNAATPVEETAGDYLICLEKAYAQASYITVNISSPNTRNLRDLQSESTLRALLEALKNKQAALSAKHARYVPLAVKIAPDLDESQIDAVARVAEECEIDGIIATNTTIDKTAVADSPLAEEAGGLSGAPVFRKSNAVLAQLAERLNGRIPLIGAGGIMSGADAAEKNTCGAAAIQVYSGLIYRGPALVHECIRACSARTAAADAVESGKISR